MGIRNAVYVQQHYRAKLYFVWVDSAQEPAVIPPKSDPSVVGLFISRGDALCAAHDRAELSDFDVIYLPPATEAITSFEELTKLLESDTFALRHGSSVSAYREAVRAFLPRE